MRRIISGLAAIAVAATTIALAPTANASGVTIDGSGSSFAGNFMTKCIASYHASTGNTVNYTAGGSGGGRTAYANNTVDFAVSDVPYQASDSAKPADGSYLYVPLTGGPVAIAFNVSGVTSLKLTPVVLSKIFKGTITSWSDTAIVDLNKSAKAKLTAAGAISVIRRGTKSGTTQNVQAYLHAVADSSWPAADGNWQGVTGTSAANSGALVDAVKSTRSSIGYADLSDTVGNSLHFVALANAKGKFIKPSAKAGAKFLAAQADPGTNGIVNLNFTKKITGAYQLTIMTYLIAPKSATGKSATVRSFAQYAVKTCSNAPAYGYNSLKSGKKVAVYNRAVTQADYIG
jgi:phosphate transport system substrate-binding protein